VSDFDPLTAIHYIEQDPGKRWRKDDRIALDLDHPLDSERILTPNVLRVAGGYRMYYTGLGPARRDPDALGYILSAFSDDAVTWRKDPGVRVDLFPPHASARALCPDVIPLEDGRYRMYFEARSGVPASVEGRFLGPAQPTVILSAVSDDGLSWSAEEGVRFGDDEWSYGTPRVLYVVKDDGTVGYRMYFHRYTFPLHGGLDAGNHIISAASSDGLTFAEEPGVRIRQESERETFSVYAPEVVRLGDGSYRMYYSGWGDTIQGGIFTATSADGVEWRKSPEPCIELGGAWDGDMVSEPCVIDLKEGGARLFYEAADGEQNYRILSATSA
jgi:hypothetical protein